MTPWGKIKAGGTVSKFGTVLSGGVAKAAKALNLVPTNVGRPIKINNDRTLSSSLSKNSLNAIYKSTIPDLFSTNLKVTATSSFTIFSNNSNNKTKKQNNIKNKWW